MRSIITSPQRVGPRGQAARENGARTAAVPAQLPVPSSKMPDVVNAAVATQGRGPMKIRVVVAEDHPLVREGVIRALTHDPAIEVVGAAKDGIDAMELAHALNPDVMLLDLSMPGLGGAGVLERLRAELPAIRALVMSANASPESLHHAVAAGAVGYLSKLTTGEQLRQAVITSYGGGSVIAPELASHLLRAFSGDEQGQAQRPLLTTRELEIVRLVADGMTDDEIGRRLFISPRTVQNHLVRTRQKTGLRRRTEIVRWAMEHAVA